MYNETTVLPPKPNSLSTAPSLRRTLSAADMSSSSHKWMINSPSLKRAQSSDQLGALDEFEQEINHDNHQDDHREIDTNNNEEKRGAFDDIWSSILSNKKTEVGSGSGSGSGSDAPYVHPLVKRTASSLSEKSLEICTESLGSETGSDGFGSEELQPEPDHQPEVHDVPISNFNATPTPTINVEYETTKEYNYSGSFNYKRVPPTPTKSSAASSLSSSASFPPPLPSLSHRMRAHRQDGRLVVEAVSVATTTCLRAHRRDGRLLLTLSSDSGDADVADEANSLHQGAQDFNEDGHDQNDDDENDNDVERKELRIEFVMEEQASCGMIMSKVIGSEWRRPRNFNTTVIKDLDDNEDEEKSLSTEIPSVITPLNAYEYYWRRTDGPHATALLKQLPSQVVLTDEKGNNKWVLGRKITAQGQTKAQQEEKVKVKEVEVEKAAEYLVPLLRGCKEPRRPLLVWESHCIATS